MGLCGQRVMKILLCSFLSIFVIHLECSAGNQVDQQKMEMPVVTSEHCTYENSDQDCAAGTDNGETYAGPGKVYQEVQEEVTESENKYQDFLHRSMGRLEGMLEESRTQVMEKLRKIMDKMAHSRDHMIKKLDEMLDTVSHSKLVTDIDRLLEEVSHSKIIEDMKSLPRELKDSLLLSVRNRSYVAAGIMCIITMAVLVGGSLYFALCHHEGWSLDCKALGVNAVAEVIGAVKDQSQDKEDFAAAKKEIKDGERNLNTEKSGGGEEKGVIATNGLRVRNLSKDDERSEAAENQSSDSIGDHDKVSTGASVASSNLESKKDS